MSGQTVKLTIRRGEDTTEILTGTSYKDWWTQAVEFIYRNYGSEDKGWRWQDISDLDIFVENSRSRWIGWGGLKWCTVDNMQQQLNREGVQQNEPDNPKPRKFNDFDFQEYEKGYDKLIKELRRY